MDLILCHTTADFDALGAAVGLTRLLPGSKIVLTGGAHPSVQDFLALYRDEYPTIERRAVNPAQIRSLTVVDTQKRDRLGKAAEWLDLPYLQEIVVYDHHLGQSSDIPTMQVYIEPVGASTTIVVEKLQQANVALTIAEATAMALGIHVDTGSLTFELSTARDAIALAWLMQQGANLAVINDYIEPGLSPQLQQLLQVALERMKYLSVRGQKIAWVTLTTDRFVPGLSSLAARIRSIVDIDALLLAHEFSSGVGETRLTIIGRSQIPHVNLDRIFQPLGGGGHAQAASISLRGTADPHQILQQAIDSIAAKIPHPPTARDLMSAPVRTIRPDTTIAEAQRILLRYGHSGLPVVDETDTLTGMISRRDIDIALHHGFSHAPVKGYMTEQVKTITVDTLLPEIQSLMVTYDLGRLPVLAKGQLVGIVTRTDLLRQLHREGKNQGVRGSDEGDVKIDAQLWLADKLAPQLWELLVRAARAAERRGWHLYLVGGAVRDLLLAGESAGNLLIKDIDLVVDGFHQAADVGAGVQLAQELQQAYPQARLDIHGAFQTAALLWHQDSAFDSLWVDIATARTEFYPYPAANPEVEASSIRQDLYRRDFTINAMALRLTSSGASEGDFTIDAMALRLTSSGASEGDFTIDAMALRPTSSGASEPEAMTLLDFFGGWQDLQAKQMRVLHPNSFIEDPTRIFRGVRLAMRLGFGIEPQTEAYIRYAIDSGVYDRTARENTKTPALQTRLKTELKYLLQAPYWRSTLELLANLGALKCIDPTLKLDAELLSQLRLLERCLHRFDRQQKIVHWQLRLEVIIAHLAPEYRDRVAKNLQLPADAIARLQNLAAAESELSSVLPTCQQPSQVVKILHKYELSTLILVALRRRDLPIIRRQLWKYLTVWMQVKPILTGNDLRKLGYQPGPQYRLILDDLLDATLDGKIADRSAAEAFVARY